MGPRPFSRGNPFRASIRYVVPDGLQWGHGLSAVETGRPWPASANRSCFNGATAFQPWKRYPARTRNLPGCWLQWGHGLSAVETGLLEGDRAMGLAASMGPRPFSRGNRSKSAAMPSVPFKLQWGHGLSAVETNAPHGGDDRRLRGFNGATAFQPWKLSARFPCRTANRWLQWGHGLSAVETTA